MTVRMITADVFEGLAQLADESVHCVVTSPPYWGLRDYGTGRWEGGDPTCLHKVRENCSAETSTLNGSKANCSHAHQGFKETCPRCGAIRVDAQIGSEPTLAEHIDVMVRVFGEVRRVLRADGTLWLNYGDAYAGSWGAQSRGGPPSEHSTLAGNGHIGGGPKLKSMSAVQIAAHPKGQTHTGSITRTPGLKPKDLMMMPARLAIALQDAGWWVRSEIIWHKLNPMPESCRDRPTSSHEKVYLLTKSGGNATIWKAQDTLEWASKPDRSERLPDPHNPGETIPRWSGYDYFYDADAVRENCNVPTWDDGSRTFGGANKHGANAKQQRTTGRVATARKIKIPGGWDLGEGAHGTINRQGRTSAQYRERGHARPHNGFNGDWDQRSAKEQAANGRNMRNVWSLASEPCAEAHFATMPSAIAERCIKAGCPAGGTVLDPFSGAGTTAMVADRLGRDAIGIDLNANYVAIAERRIAMDRLKRRTGTMRDVANAMLPPTPLEALMQESNR